MITPPPCFFFSSRRRHTRSLRDWSSDVCSSDLSRSVPAGTDRLLHFLAPVLTLVPVLVTFAVVPFGDVLRIGDRVIDLQAAPLNVGILYVLAMASLAVYGVVLAGWASNNRWSLLGGIRGSAQMISYEIAMG